MGNLPGKQGKITDFKPLVYETLVFATCKFRDIYSFDSSLSKISVLSVVLLM